MEPVIDLQSDAYFMSEALRMAVRAYEAEEVPIGAVASVVEERLHLRGAVLDPAGQRRVEREIHGPAADAEALGRQLAQELIDAGAVQLLRVSGR